MNEDDLYYLKRNSENEGITVLDKDNYIGDYFQGYLTLVLTNFPTFQEEFNWEYLLDFLKKNKINYEIVSYGHWLVGNYKRIGIYPNQPKLKPNSNTPKKLRDLDDLFENLEYGGLLDEDSYSEFIYDKFYDYMDESGFKEIKNLVEEELNLKLELPIIEELWEDFAQESSWEYEHDDRDFILNTKDFLDSLKDFDGELYFAKKNPKQLALFN
jgi:hypothetical protein